MGYELDVDENLQAVILVHYGRVSIDELKAGRQASADLLVKTKLSRLIVDLTQRENLPSTVEQFDFSSGHHEVYPLGTRSAILITPAALDALKFAENVAINRGMQTRVFTDIGDARAWLSTSSE